MHYLYQLWIIVLLLTSNTLIAQLTPTSTINDCPPNIGFEAGSFNNWACYEGRILKDGSLDLGNTIPIANKHTLISASNSLQQFDPYGGFPVNCPNGSGYSVRLGNSLAGGQAESVSYTFTIPPTQNDYSIIYNYAGVFQNPAHNAWE